MLRQIILDTETTGIGHDQGHRLIEIGCIELIDRRLTGKHFHRYINPERKVDEGAFKVHGLSDEFLSDKPKFAEINKEFVEFVEGAELIIHNAPFDVGFINAEFKRIDKSLKLESFCQVTDTLVLAKQKHPGQRNSLDALCKRYQIDATDRVLHGALLDAQLLADVYLAMTSGQKKLELNENTVKLNQSNHQELVSHSPVYFASEEELEEHRHILNQIQKKAGQLIWPNE